MTTEQVIKVMADQLTDQALLRWLTGRGVLGPTLQQHVAAYFIPNPVSISLIRAMGTQIGADTKKVETLYHAMIEAQRIVWRDYTPEQAQQVYEDWRAHRPQTVDPKRN